MTRFIGSSIDLDFWKAWKLNFDRSSVTLPVMIRCGAVVSAIILQTLGNTEAQGPLAQVSYMKSDLPLSNANYGWQTDADGDRIVIGAPDDLVSMARGGSAYVYARQGHSWILEAKLVAPQADDNDFFGTSVAICGDTVLVGAPFEDGSSPGLNGDQQDNSASNSGAAYAFERVAGNWVLSDYIKASNPDVNDYFGSAVELIDNQMIVSAPREDSASLGVGGDQNDNFGMDTGAIYAFSKIQGMWTQEAYIKAPNPSGSFGAAIDLQLNELVVGAPQEGSGAAYAYSRVSGTWATAWSVSSPALQSYQFGSTVQVSADTLCIGAPGDQRDVTGVGGLSQGPGFPFTFLSGAIYLYERAGSGWSQALYIKPPQLNPGQAFGRSIALDDLRLFVGAPGDDTGGVGIDPDPTMSMPPKPESGSTFFYHKTGGSWLLEKTIKATNSDTGDGFGLSISLLDDRLLVGAPYEMSLSPGIDSNQLDNSGIEVGAVYCFDTDGPDASVESFIAGSNVQSLAAPAPVLGTNWCSVVDTAATPHPLAVVAGFLRPAMLGPIFSNQWLLVGPQFPAGEIFGFTPLAGTPLANFCTSIPDHPSLSGQTFYLQAAHLGGPSSPSLSNALTLVIGN